MRGLESEVDEHEVEQNFYLVLSTLVVYVHDSPGCYGHEQISMGNSLHFSVDSSNALVPDHARFHPKGYHSHPKRHRNSS